MTPILTAEQVDYRLVDQAGCHIGDSRHLPGPAAAGGLLVWMGSGLPDAGLRAGQALDSEGKAAARLLMNGCHPATGARLVPSQMRAHPDAMLAGARLLDGMSALAARRGVKPADLLEGKPKQQRQLATLERMVHRFGEAHRVQVDTLYRLARAAGVRLEDVYDREVLNRAREHRADRIDIRVRGWDLVADLPKSLGALPALMGPEDELAFRELVHQAKREAFGELERWIGYAVASRNGDRVRIATGGLMGWSVEHHSARPVDDTPGDPHLHVHLVLANLALCEDGQWRSIANSGRDLYRHAKVFDALFKARVRALATVRFGMRFEQDPRTGAWEAAGFPLSLRQAFSRRTAQIDAATTPGADLKEKARISQATRYAKHETDRTDLRATWRRRAEDLGIDVEALVAAVAPGPPDASQGPQHGPADGPHAPDAAPTAASQPQSEPLQDLAAIVFDPDSGVTATDKEFSYARLLAAVAHALPQGINAEPGRLEELANALLALPTSPAVPLPHRGPDTMSSTARYTTVDILAAEQQITDQARTRYADGSALLTDSTAHSALNTFEAAAGHPLSEEQRRTALRLLTAGHGIDALVGAPGTGKTTVLEACRIGWDKTGLTYAGACPSPAAAQSLYRGSGIPSRTITYWLERIRGGSGLAGVDVLVLDEAGMTDDRSLAALLSAAAHTGTKVIAVGAAQQFTTIGPGGGFAEVHRLVGGTVLAENRRHRRPEDKAIWQAWQEDRHHDALQLLADSGRIHATDTAEQARTEILTAWNRARARWRDPHDTLSRLAVLAARQEDTDDLNHATQAARRAAGELGVQHTYALSGGERLTLAVGDFVRLRPGEGPDALEGSRALITALDSDHNVQITWRTHPATGPARTASAWLTPAQIATGTLSLGYATTIADSHGMTMHTALIYGHGGNAHALHPITRTKEASHLWLPTTALETEETRFQLGPPRSDTERLERAITAYATLLGQDRPGRMVSDRLRPPPRPAGTAQPWHQRRLGHLPTPHLKTLAQQETDRALHAERLAHHAQQEAEHLATILGTDQAPAHHRHLDRLAHLARAEDHHRRALAARTDHAITTEHLAADEALARQLQDQLKQRRAFLLGKRRHLTRRHKDLTEAIAGRHAHLDRLQATIHAHTTALTRELEPLTRHLDLPPSTPPAQILTAARDALPDLLARDHQRDTDTHHQLRTQARNHRAQAAHARTRVTELHAEALLRAALPAQHAAREDAARASQQATRHTPGLSNDGPTTSSPDNSL